MATHRFLQFLGLGMICIFVGVEHGGWFSLATVFPYALYGFEAIFGSVVIAIYGNFCRKKRDFTFGGGVAFFFALAAGFATCEASGLLGYALPFSARDPETILFLLLLGPLLEEWIFRGALWKLLEYFFRSPWPAFLITSAAFSYAHYFEIKDVNPQFFPFIRYQAIYTLGLGLFCGGVRIQFGWIAALIVHLAFNFGFWLAAV